jgi:hypothetical protein
MTDFRRIPFLETGILDILSNATNGIGIVLEHRYYGHSVPVPNLSTDNLRFLNNEEALEDSANVSAMCISGQVWKAHVQFIRNFYPPAEVLKLDDPSSLRPKKTPWIYYGGSYAGARAAHMRVEYPDLVWGAIASSGMSLLCCPQVSFTKHTDNQPSRTHKSTSLSITIRSNSTVPKTAFQPCNRPSRLSTLFSISLTPFLRYSKECSGWSTSRTMRTLPKSSAARLVRPHYFERNAELN